MSMPSRAANDVASAVAVAAVTPNASSSLPSASGRASAMRKEDERRRELLLWQESKASGKKAVVSVAAPIEKKAAVPDRKAQFFERRERRLQEEARRKRLSQMGKENHSSRISSSTPKATIKRRDDAAVAAPSFLLTPRAMPAPEARGRLAGSTPASTVRGPAPTMGHHAATTPSAAARSASTPKTPAVVIVATAAAATAERGTASAQAGVGTPSRSSALLRPKASTYKERGRHRLARTAPGDRLSRQLARLGAITFADSSQREGLAAVSAGAGEATAREVAWCESCQDSGRSSATAGSWRVGAFTVGPVVGAGGAVAGGSVEVDRSCLTSSVAATPTATVTATAQAAEGVSTFVPFTKPLRVSSRSPNAPTPTPRQCPPNAMPGQLPARPGETNGTGSGASTESPAEAGAAKTDGAMCFRSEKLLTSETFGQRGEVDAAPTESAVTERTPTKAVEREPVTTKAVEPGRSKRVESVAAEAETEALGLGPAAGRSERADVKVVAADGNAMGTVSCRPAPAQVPRPRSSEKPASQEATGGKVGIGAELTAGEASRRKIATGEIASVIHFGEGEGPISLTTGTVFTLAPAPLNQGLPVAATVAAPGTSCALLAGTASGGQTAAAAAAAFSADVSPAIVEETESMSTTTGVKPAATLSSVEGAVILGDDPAATQRHASLFSRSPSSSFSWRQQQQSLPTATKPKTEGDSSETEGGGSTAPAASEVERQRAGEPSQAPNLHWTEEKSATHEPMGNAETPRNHGHSPEASLSGSARLNALEKSPSSPVAGVPEARADGAPPCTGSVGGAQMAPATTSPAEPLPSRLIPQENLATPASESQEGADSGGQRGSAQPGSRETAEEANESPDRRPRPGLTPPGYRSRSSPLSTADTSAAPDGRMAKPLSAGSREDAKGSHLGKQSGPAAVPMPVPASTPTRYRSSLSLPPAAEEISLASSSSAEPRPTGLTPPGYRSRRASLPAGRGATTTELRGLDTSKVLAVGAAAASFGGGKPSAKKSGVIRPLTPDRRDAIRALTGGNRVGLPVRTPLRCVRGLSSELSSPEQPRPPQGQQQQMPGDDSAAQFERGSVGSRLKHASGSPKARDDCCAATADDRLPPASIGLVFEGTMVPPGSFSSARRHQQQQDELHGKVASPGARNEDDKAQIAEERDNACSPKASDGGGSSGSGSGGDPEDDPEDAVPPECSTDRSITAGAASSSPLRSGPAATEGLARVGEGEGEVEGNSGATSRTPWPGGRTATRPQPTSEADEVGPLGFLCSPNFAAGFVAGRRKRRAVSGVPVVTAAAETAAASPVVSKAGSGCTLSPRLERSKRSRGAQKDGRQEEEQEGEEQSSGDESGSSWETCSSSEEEEEQEEGMVVEPEGEWRGMSNQDEIDDGYAYTGGVVIDPDLVRSGSSSSNGGGSVRSSSSSSQLRSSCGEARSGGGSSWPPPSVSRSRPCVGTAEMGTQTSPDEGVANVLVQAGDGRLLSEAELQDEYDRRELREMLKMMNEDLLTEVFHREVVKQEEAQTRRKLEASLGAEIRRLEDALKAAVLNHNNEKVKMRWEHADELARVEAEAGDGGGGRQELLDERRLREEDEKRHAAALQRERQQRREWERRCDDHVREKREQGRRHREEIRAQVEAERKAAESEAKKKMEALKAKLDARHREAQRVIKMHLEAYKELDQEIDELRRDNNQLRAKLGLEIVEYDQEAEEEEEETREG